MLKRTFFVAAAYLCFLINPSFPSSSNKKNSDAGSNTNNLESKIVVDISDRKMFLYQNGEVEGYPVTVGKDKSTPIGEFRIINKVKNPDWWPSPNCTWLSDKVNEYVDKQGYVPNESPSNPFGAYWIGISTKSVNGSSYGIHGTNDPSSIGKAVSHGCIRAQKEALEEIIKFPVGTKVIIRK